jgi:hypothetical protein
MYVYCQQLTLGCHDFFTDNDTLWIYFFTAQGSFNAVVIGNNDPIDPFTLTCLNQFLGLSQGVFGEDCMAVEFRAQMIGKLVHYCFEYR